MVEICLVNVLIISVVLHLILVAIFYKISNSLKDDDTETNNNKNNNEEPKQMINIGMFISIVLVIVLIVSLLSLYYNTKEDSKVSFSFDEGYL